MGPGRNRGVLTKFKKEDSENATIVMVELNMGVYIQPDMV